MAPLFLTRNFLFQKLIPLLLLFLIFTLAVGSGFAGVDFGRHWDEYIVLTQVEKAFDSGLLLTRYYIYPSLAFYLALPSVAPELIQFFISQPRDSSAQMVFMLRFKTAMQQFLKSDAFKWRVRKCFIVISMLVIFWVYLLVMVWRRDAVEALVAAALTGFSWEIAYHARWVVPDAVMTQFTALTLMCLVFSWVRPNFMRWIKLAAVAAALTTGSKYQGGILLLPVLMTLVWKIRGSSLERNRKVFLGPVISVFLIFAVTYIFTTPGTIWDPVKFLQNLGQQMARYKTGHIGYTVSAGLEHFMLMLFYFAFVAFSKYPVIAVFFFALAVCGVTAMIFEEDKWRVISFLSFPVFYLLYMSSQRIMIVRNILLLVPVFAIFAARGFSFISHRVLKGPGPRAVFAALVALAIVANGAWTAYAGHTIRQRANDSQIAQVARYIDEHPKQIFLVSRRIVEELKTLDFKTHPNISEQLTPQTQRAIFYSSEFPVEKWLSNRWNYTLRWFGSYEVNLNYYPTWLEEHAVVMPIDSALEVIRG